MRLVGGDGDGLELGTIAEHSDTTLVLVTGFPSLLQGLGLLVPDVLVRRQDAARNGGIPKEPRPVLLGPEPEPDGLTRIGDRAQAFQLAGPGVGLDVEDVGGVLLDPAHADDAAAVAVSGHGHPVGVD
jgi:hypothetical protein